MDSDEPSKASPVLLTETEVAQRLRCSAAKIKRLRSLGRLAFLPGRPVLIDEADLVRFIEASKRGASAPPGKPPPPAVSQDSQKEAKAETDAWLRKTLLKQRFATRRG